MDTKGIQNPKGVQNAKGIIQNVKGIQTGNRQSEPNQNVKKLDKYFVMSILVIILVTPLYGVCIYYFYDSPRKLAMTVLSYALIVPWWLLMAESWSLEKDCPAKARKWRAAAAILQVAQAILPLVCLEWWKMANGDAFTTWACSIFYLILVFSMHSDLILGERVDEYDDGAVHPSTEMV